MNKYLAVALIILASVGATLYFTKDNNSLDKVVTGSGSVEDASQTQTEIKPSDVGDYSNNNYTKFPENALKDKSIKELNLSGNSLTGSLPGEIRFLTKLEVLNVSDNNMTGIPAEVGQLSNLRILNYANNDLTGLPNELGNLQKLEILNLSGNNPSQQDLDGIRAKLPSTTQIIL